MELAIKDPESYNQELSKSLPEKLFFLNRIKTRLYVDFGCGDGSILKAIRKDQPDALLFGVENDQVQFALASQHALVFPTFSHFELGDYEWMTKTAIFSSVLHESPELILHALAHEFDYIVIRDMALSDEHRYREDYLSANLKARYRHSPEWEREKSEDYFQLKADMGLAEGYRCIHFEYTAPDYIRTITGEDTPTHIKGIWKRIKE